MEELKEINFNGSLQKNKYATITYSGELFKSNSSSCYIVYGYGESWEHTTEQEMEKNESGFSVDIKILDYNKINFCFRNEIYSWDNNNSNNYSSPIGETEATPSFILNENILVDILSNIYERDIAKIESTRIKDFTVETERAVPMAIEESIGEVELEDSLESDLNKVLSEIYEANNKPVQTIEVEQEEKTVDQSYSMDNVIDEVLYPIVENAEIVESSLEEDVKITEEETLFDTVQEFNTVDDTIETNQTVQEAEITKKDTNADINQVVDDVVESIHKPVSKIETTEASSDLDDEEIKRQVNEIVNTVLDQVIQSDEFKDEDSEDISNALIVRDENKFVVSARQLSSFYIMKKRIKLAFYKVFYAIPRMLKSFYGEDAGNK